MKCSNCGKEVYGFWKYRLLLPPVCSKHCLRVMINQYGLLNFGDKETPDKYTEFYSKIREAPEVGA